MRKAFTVEVFFNKDGPYGAAKETLKNITEIHYNYKSLVEAHRIAFESDIDGTGYTYLVKHIDEFEAKLNL